ncbi:phage tail terminator protein [Candidatus Magnetaquicoccus inordinatus]|uniref:phage tail terminator protein n=1 Tax=Candidatus Magnetaquicoccus inordinatus TaxID=2496818 RepID=UPI00102B5E60|nr:hypothetical protein [Candidatus Magnetaquicoccus inordinatus]
MNDLFFAQELLVNRLTEQVNGLRLVQGVRDAALVQERPGTTPAAYVLYDGQDLRMHAGRAQVVDQKWLVMLVIRSLRDHPVKAMPGEGRQEAGPLLVHLCRALLGWRPAMEYGPLSLLNAPNPSFRDGFGYYPLRFATRTVIRAE